MSFAQSGKACFVVKVTQARFAICKTSCLSQRKTNDDGKIDRTSSPPWYQYRLGEQTKRSSFTVMKKGDFGLLSRHSYCMLVHAWNSKSETGELSMQQSKTCDKATTKLLLNPLPSRIRIQYYLLDDVSFDSEEIEMI